MSRQDATSRSLLLHLLQTPWHACGHVDNSELTVLHGVVDIEDDNTPAPENIPTNNNNLPVYDNNWHHNGSCFCCILDADNVNATIKNWPRHVIPTDLQLFEHLFPCAFVKTVMLPKMNAKMPAGAPQLQYGELLSCNTESLSSGSAFGF